MEKIIRHPTKGISRSGSKLGFTVIELLIVVSLLGILTMTAVPSFAVITAAWQKHICGENRDRLLLVMRTEMAKDEKSGLGRLKNERDYFDDYGEKYELHCPYDGQWLLEGSGDSLSISCFECENPGP